MWPMVTPLSSPVFTFMQLLLLLNPSPTPATALDAPTFSCWLPATVLKHPPPTHTHTHIHTFLFLAPFLLLQALHDSGLRTLPSPSFSCHMEPQQKSETANSTERKTLDLLPDRFSQKVRWRCISVTHRVWKCFKHKVYKWHFQTIKKMEGTESKSFHQLACEKLGFQA